MIPLDAVMAAAIHTAPAAVPHRPRNPHVSRGGYPRWGDSNDRVWRYTPTWVRSLALCIARHESVTAGHYRARNPVSSASGRYQFIDGTWRVAAREGHVYRWPRAYLAPAWAQDRAFVAYVKRHGASAWHGTWCPGT